MSRMPIPEETQRRLYAESMGRCMNPACRKKLFSENGDIIEKAHIDPYCDTADNSFENLVVLCPNCHTDFDKNHAFTAEEVLRWKKVRHNEVERMFSKRYASFEDLRKDVVPILEENKSIYENYYLKSKDLWKQFEAIVLMNNRKLKYLLSANLDLFQDYTDKSSSNMVAVRKFLQHVEEFEITRSNSEMFRVVLFPPEIDSMFGIEPVEESIFPSTESLEKLIESLMVKGTFVAIHLGEEKPCVYYKNNEGDVESLYLTDAPRLRQMYYDNKCFRQVGVRLKSLNFALTYINSRGLKFEFIKFPNLREIAVGGKHMIFVYEYCLSAAFLMELAPYSDIVIVNLHNWNGSGCISREAYDLAKSMNIHLLTMEDFYRYINGIRQNNY